MGNRRIAILYHNYYSLEGVQDMRERIEALNRQDILLLCSLPEKFTDQAPFQRSTENFMITANAGKDIGGKLLLIQLLMNIYAHVPYAILLHDKRSYHKHSGRWERDNLLNIITPRLFPVIEAAFERDAQLGIACAKGSIRNEYLGNGRFDTPNSALLQEMLENYAIPDKDLRFVAGTMFWIRTSILRQFFSRWSALAIRKTLEVGNVLDHEKGSITHCWERMLTWIATSAGYTVKEF